MCYKIKTIANKPQNRITINMWGKYYLYGGTKIFPDSDFATPPPPRTLGNTAQLHASAHVHRSAREERRGDLILKH